MATQDDEPTLKRPRRAATYRAARRNEARKNGGLSRKSALRTFPSGHKPIAYKQAREAHRRRRQAAALLAKMSEAA